MRSSSPAARPGEAPAVPFGAPSSSTTASPSTTGRGWQRGTERPIVLGHRGASRYAPENTFKAFELAVQQGADGVELDVRLNASGDVVVCHDDELNRVTRGRHAGRVSQTTTSQCSCVVLPEGQALPRLWQVLQWAERSQALVNIEMKADGPLAERLPRALSAELARAGSTTAQCLVSSFDWRLLHQFAGHCPSAATGWLLDRGELARLAEVPARGAAHPHHAELSLDRVQHQLRRGVVINTWTVNDASRAVELARFGVNCLIGDDPALLLQALSSVGAG